MAASARVLVTRQLPASWLQRLRARVGVVDVYDSPDAIPRQTLLERIKGASGVLCMLTDQIDAQALDAAGKQLAVVSTMSVGFDHVDVEACRARQVVVGNTPGVLTDATADLTMALLLATCRRLPEAIASAKDGRWGAWNPTWMCGVQLRGSTVGIVGLGRIGMAIASRLKGFGIGKLLYTASGAKDHEGQFVTLSELLVDSDVVIVSCALTPETAGLLNKEAFASMKSSAVLINTARGGVVNQDDLVEALTTGQIQSAGLDVTTPEPLPPSHPLFALPNCVILPHIGSATDVTRQEMAGIAVENLLRALEGKAPLHSVA